MAARRRSSGTLPYCSICHHGYRGIYPVHASTASHLAAAGRRSTPRISHRGDLARSLGYSRLNIQRALAGDRGEDKQRVRRHNRRRPLDGPRKSVRVTRYWRGIPWRPTILGF